MKTSSANESKWFSVNMLFLCLVGLFLNYALAQLAILLNLPLYLDNIGSILVAVLGGPIAGMTVGFISNATNSLTDPITLYYGILTVFIALTASVFSHNGWFRKVKGALCAAGCFVIIGGAVGSCMTWMLYGGGIGEGISAPYANVLVSLGFSDFWAQFTADILIDIPDKLITVFLVFGFLKHYPKKLYGLFPYSYLYDRSEEESNALIRLRKSRFRKRSVNTRILTLIIVCLLSISSSSTVVGIILARQDQRELYTAMVTSVANIAAHSLDGDLLETFLDTGSLSEAYASEENKLRTLMDNTTRLKYLYVYQITEDGYRVIFDLDKEGASRVPFGTILPLDPALEENKEHLLNGEAIEPSITSAQSGSLITAYEPIRNSSGKTVAYACADLSVTSLRNMTLSYIIKMFAIQFGLSMLIIAYAAWYARRKVVAPINSIVELSQKFDETEPDIWLESDQWKNREAVHTGDEIEALYRTICQVEENTANNVTKLKRSEELEKANAELAAAIEQAREASQAKSTFLSRMSHDIRTPLNVIIGMSRLAQENPNPPDTRECLEKISISSEFLLGLVNDILDMERIESGKTELHPVPYSEPEFRSYIETVIKPLCQNKGIAFIYSSDVSESAPALQDKLRINQIYFNLLSNAVKFTPEGGQIRLHLSGRRWDDSHIEIDASVSDTGIGMSEEFQKHMFESFTQENQVTPSVSQGSGLGLSIVRHMCDLMNMTISVKSAPGKGTTYDLHGIFELAEMPSANEQKQDVNSAKDYSVLKNKLILVCEDHMLNQEIIKRILQKHGMIPVLAEDGKKGIDTFLRSAPNEFAAILMDIQMPVMNGIEATRKIRSLSRPDAQTIPIIAMTANVYVSDMAQTREAGMNAHLAKPIDPDTVYKTLAEWIR